jgi:hypothetical protein
MKKAAANAGAAASSADVSESMKVAAGAGVTVAAGAVGIHGAGLILLAAKLMSVKWRERETIRVLRPRPPLVIRQWMKWTS